MGTKTFWDRKGGYGVMLDEYNGNYSLIAGKQTEQDLYKDWVFLSKWSQSDGGFVPDNKKRPMGVYLGERDSACEALRFFLTKLESEDEGVPF